MQEKVTMLHAGGNTQSESVTIVNFSICSLCA